MQIYQYNPQTIAILNNPNSVMYRDDGTIDVDLLQQLIHRFGQCVTYYDALPYLYYVLRLPLKEQKEIDTALSFWKTVIEKHSGALHEILSNLPQLHKHNIPYVPHIQWLMQTYPLNQDPAYANKHLSSLAKFGLAVYLQQDDIPNTSVVPFLPPDVKQMTRKEILTNIDATYPLDYKKLINHTKNTDVTLQKYIALFAFAQILKSNEKSDDDDDENMPWRSLETAIDLVWPRFKALDISLTEVLHGLGNVSKKLTLSTALLEWSDSQHAEQYPEARADVRIFIQDEMHKLAQMKRAWKHSEFPWAKFASSLNPEDPLYPITRKKIAQAIIAEQAQKTIPLSDLEALSLALRAGKETLEELLDAWKKDGHKNIHSHLESLLCDAHSEGASEIVNHPLLHKYVSPKKLWKRIYSPEKLDYDGLYEMYKRIHDPDSECYVSQVAERIIRMSDYQQTLQDGTSFKDAIGVPLYLHFWSILGFEMYFATEREMADASDFVTDYASIGIPDALHAIMCLDPEFYRAHREDIGHILASPDQKDTAPIYKRWLTELFGPLYANQNIQDLMIRNGKGIEEFFTQLYIQHHPELGYNITEALSLDGL